jgi:hypothetical protein
LFITHNVSGQVILSEVLSNEPGGRVRLEWIEIYNQSSSETNLGDYILVADNDTNYLADGIFLGPQSYAVLARQLIPDNGSDAYESYWGDSSGVWGDAYFENYIALDIDVTLSNNYGNVILMSIENEVIDEVSWVAASDDGRSIERSDVDDYYSTWHDCYDPDGSTPGRVNSQVPQSGEGNFSVTIEPIVISVGDNGFEDFFIDIIAPPGTKLTIKIFDETGYKVKSLLDNSETAVLRLEWDGKDDQGGYLSPGIYIISFVLSGRNNEEKNYPVIIAP